MSSTFIVHKLTRRPRHGMEDELKFVPGVNVLVGPPNTGKTRWLKILDYLLADTDPTEDSLGEAIADKYDSAEAQITMAGEQHVIERRWKETGNKGKVFVDGSGMDAHDFATLLMQTAGFPVLRYPQGNPRGNRTWPELNWRSLLRHMYRRSKLWSDIADRQPESEQHACLTQFLGLAEFLFSENKSKLAAAEKKAESLQVQRAQFIDALDRITSKLMPDGSSRRVLTTSALEEIREQLRQKLTELENLRSQTVSSIKVDVAKTPAQSTALQELTGEWSTAVSSRQDVSSERKRLERRIAEIEVYRSSTMAEIARVSRTLAGGTVISEFRVTNCPVCDQPVNSTNGDSNCFLCHQVLPSRGDDEESRRRLEYELGRLESELDEAELLVTQLRNEHEEVLRRSVKIDRTVDELSADLKPFRRAAAALIPPQLAQIDTEIGRIEERLVQLQSIRSLIDDRDSLSRQIDESLKDAKLLEARVAEEESSVDFTEAADVLTDEMNNYLSKIAKLNPRSWNQGRVDLHLDDRAFRFLVDGKKWTKKLGDTLTLYFLLSYHYGLLSLTDKPRRHYPGFLVIDFPPKLEDGSTVRDHENFILQPFVELLSKNTMLSCQVIAAGSAFEQLKGANRIELTKIWT